MISVSAPKNQNPCIALLGGGGKTSLMKKLGAELSSNGQRVILTSLTRMLNDPDDHVRILDYSERKLIPEILDSESPLHIMTGKTNESKLQGWSSEFLREIYSIPDVCIFECDGARNLPLKCHNDRDPEVPDFVSQVLIIVGADVINTTLRDGLIHRPELFIRKWKIDRDFILHADFLAEVLTSEKGYLQKVPHNQEIIFYINKTDIDLDSSRDLAEKIAERSRCHTWIGSLKNSFCEQVA